MHKDRLVLLVAVALVTVASFGSAQTFHDSEQLVTFEHGRLAAADDAHLARYLFQNLAATMRRDVTILHLKYFIEDHPELTSEQRLLVFEAIGILAAGAAEADHSTAAWNDEFEPALRTIEQRARQVFEPRLLREAFLGFGQTDEPSRPAHGKITGDATARWRLKTETDDCDCSVAHNWCDLISNPDPNCVSTIHPDNCVHSDSGCGFLEIYACDGLCSRQ